MSRLFSFVFAALIAPISAGAHPVQFITTETTDGDLTVVTSKDAGPDTPFAIASVGKLITSVAVLRLAQNGQIDINAPAAQYLDGDIVAGFEGLKGITVRHMLTMTSGLPDYYGNAFLEDALDDPAGVQRPEVAVSYVYDEPLLFKPGQRYDYSNTNYVLLGLMVEQITGRSYARAMSDLVLKPAKMKNSFVFGSRSLPKSFVTGHEDGSHIRDYYEQQGFGDGGVISTARDMSKFYTALFWDETLLSATAMKALMSDPVGSNYGMGVEVEDGIAGHSGGDLGFSSDVRIDLEDGTVTVQLVGEGNAELD